MDSFSVQTKAIFHFLFSRFSFSLLKRERETHDHEWADQSTSAEIYGEHGNFSVGPSTSLISEVA